MTRTTEDEVLAASHHPLEFDMLFKFYGRPYGFLELE